MGVEGWWVRELELHLDSVHLRSSAFSITPAMLLKITGGKGFIIRQIWVGPFLLTLINATKLGRLLTLSKVQLSHQLSLLGAGISTQYYCEHHTLSTGSGSQKMLSK